jgi:membrane protease YdiL (CAAX protease family)
LLLILTFFIHRNEKLKKYREVVFAFFCGSFGLFLAWAPGSWPQKYFGVSTNTAQDVAILKFFETLPIVLAIIVLTKIVQGSLAPLYIQKGNLRLGLGIGLPLSIVIVGVYLVFSWPKINFSELVSSLPWMMIFAISNAFFEELLIRGLFLKRYSSLLGPRWALILSTLCYGFFFLGVQSAAGPIPYGSLILILPLGLLYGFIMQKSDSIWGSVSLHTTIDLVFLISVFATT